MFLIKSMLFNSFRAVVFFAAVALSQSALAQETLYVYGPGGPAPAMKEAATAFEKTSGVKVEVSAGPTPQWLDKAKTDADLIFSGSETMMCSGKPARSERGRRGMVRTTRRSAGC